MVRTHPETRPLNGFRGWLSTILLLIALVASFWLVTAVTFANVYRTNRPQLALAWIPFDAGARSAEAARLISVDQSPTTLSRVTTLARGALIRDPTDVVAARTLGLVAALNQDGPRAEQLFQYSDRMSRRDFPTQLWLIERSVQRNDIEQALHHYDTSLRTSFTRGATLYPILIAASADPAIAVPLNKLLLDKPHWWRSFVTQLAFETKSLTTLPLVTRNLLDPSLPEDQALFAVLIGRFVRDGKYDLAWSTYQDAVLPGQQSDTWVRNGDFQQEGRYPPFDWTFVEESALSAQRELRPASTKDIALYVFASGSNSGTVAKQMLLLPPGRYNFSAIVGDVSGEEGRRPNITLSCVQAENSELFSIDFPGAGSEGGRIATDFAVPANGCKAQWLSVAAQGAEANSNAPPWIDAISINKPDVD